MENILELIELSCERFGDAPSLQFKNKTEWVTWSFTELRQKIDSLMTGLLSLGVEPGDKIAIMANTRVEWTVADLAAISCGAITVPIYQSSLADQVAYILTDSDSKGVFVENKKQLDKVLSIASHVPKLEWIAVFDPSGKGDSLAHGPAVYRLKDLFKTATEDTRAAFRKNQATISRDDDLTYVYTSGTTGNPKGVILSHHNFISNADLAARLLPLTPEKVSLSFLPLSHIMARLFQFVHLRVGFIQAFAESIDHLFNNIQETRPHFMISVPRIFEKIHTKLVSDVSHASLPKKCIFNWATQVGREAGGLSKRSLSRLMPGTLFIQHQLAKRLVYSKLHDKLGGRMEFFVSGGAPLAQDIAEFFHAFGILILEGYGLTETTAPVALNLPNKLKFGTVGHPLPNCDIKIAKDGEILVKGDPVFKGYFKNPNATEEAFSGPWFATGDIGIIDNDGFLKITDRKKDIIVTSGGKNIAPQNIENVMKTIPLVSQIMVHGDKRKFLSALIVLDPIELEKFAKQHRLSAKEGIFLGTLPAVHHHMKEELDKKNKLLASYETIKKFAIIENEFTVESGELTPTMKVKRRVVEKNYRAILDGFYHE